MIRKAIIVVLTLAAVGVLVVGVWSLMAVGVGPELTLWRDAHWTLDVVVYAGRIAVMSATPSADPGEDTIPYKWSYLGFGYKCDYFAGASIRADIVYFPFWLGVVLLGAYPVIALIRGRARRRRYRRRRGLCARCGYDLTGNVSGVCPECGTKVKRP